jgi:hypothetical protein
MTEKDLDVLLVLSRLEHGDKARSLYIGNQLGIARDKKSNLGLRSRLGRLKRQGFVADYKIHVFDDKKYWYITEKGRQAAISETSKLNP